MAQILDATAGNRSIWRTKADPRILFIDIEPELEVPPDMVLDCTATGFSDKSFHTIIFDPPHGVNYQKWIGIMTSPNRSRFPPHWKNKQPSYYGLDKFKTRVGLQEFIIASIREFRRVLQDDGCLWIKWGERTISIGEVVSIIKREGYQEMLRIPVKGPKTPSHGETYWVMFMKKREAAHD